VIQSVYAAGAPVYVPVPIITVPNLNGPPSTPPMPDLPQAPQPNAGQYTPQNPLTAPPPGYANAFTRPGPQRPVPSETVPPVDTANAFSDPPLMGRGVPPPPVPALATNAAIGGFIPIAGYPGPMPNPTTPPPGGHPAPKGLAPHPGPMHAGMPAHPMYRMPGETDRRAVRDHVALTHRLVIAAWVDRFGSSAIGCCCGHFHIFLWPALRRLDQIE
jgi:hypothetical protein